MANFSLSGNTLASSIVLHVNINGEMINGPLAFIILLEISSYPNEFFIFSDFIIFTISLVVACCHLIFEKGPLKTSAK
jgi:hypothetical protein